MERGRLCCLARIPACAHETRLENIVIFSKIWKILKISDRPHTHSEPYPSHVAQLLDIGTIRNPLMRSYQLIILNLQHEHPGPLLETIILVKFGPVN